MKLLLDILACLSTIIFINYLINRICKGFVEIVFDAFSIPRKSILGLPINLESTEDWIIGIFASKHLRLINLLLAGLCLAYCYHHNIK